MCAQSRPRLRRAASPLRLLLETRGSATAAGPVGRAAARRATWSGTAAAGDIERHGGGGAGRGPSPLGARVGGGGAPPAAAGEGHRVARAALRVPASPRMRRAGSGTHVGRPAGRDAALRVPASTRRRERRERRRQRPRRQTRRQRRRRLKRRRCPHRRRRRRLCMRF